MSDGWVPRWVSPQLRGSQRPPGCWGHTLSFCEGRLFVVGGNAKQADERDAQHSAVLSIDARTWTCRRIPTYGSYPVDRDSHTATVIGPRGAKKLLIFGGTDGDMKYNELRILDLASMTWGVLKPKSSPPERESHTATLLGSTVAVFGGSGYRSPGQMDVTSDDSTYYLSDVHFLDTDTLIWNSPKVSGRIPRGRDSHAAAAHRSSLVIFGGDCGDHYLADVHLLDTDIMEWRKLEVVSKAQPEPRAGHVMVPHNGGLLVFGGVTADGQSCHDCWLLRMGPHSGHRLNSNECFWEQIDCDGVEPQGRFAHAADFGDGALFVFGGLYNEMPMGDLHVLMLNRDALLTTMSEPPPREPVPALPQAAISPNTAINSSPAGPQERGLEPEASDANTPTEGGGAQRDTCGRKPVSTKAAKKRTRPAHSGQNGMTTSGGLSQGAAMSGGKAKGKSQGGELHPREGKVTSYNMYCTSIRNRLKEENPGTPAREIERRIGQQWQSMTMEEKRPYEEAASKHNQQVQAQQHKEQVERAAQGGVDETPGEAEAMQRYEQQRAEMNAKRAKFRSATNNQDQQSFNSKLKPSPAAGSLGGFAGLPGVPHPSASAGGRHHWPYAVPYSHPGHMPMRPDNGPEPTTSHGRTVELEPSSGPETVVMTPHPRMLGSHLEGVVDAMFNSGYLATVRMGGTTYRAVLFSPVLAVPAADSSGPPPLPPSVGGAAGHGGLTFNPAALGGLGGLGSAYGGHSHH